MILDDAHNVLFLLLKSLTPERISDCPHSRFPTSVSRRINRANLFSSSKKLHPVKGKEKTSLNFPGKPEAE